MTDRRIRPFLLLLLLQIVLQIHATEPDEDFTELTASYSSFARTKAGLVIARLTSSISAVSSVALCFVIIRSNARLSTTYHRIMLSLSITDFAASSVLALTTLPMPKPGSDIYTDSYNYDGKRMGNNATCTAQGFIGYTGKMISFMYHVSLWVFYVCTIRYRMEPKVISKYVEPFMHIFSHSIPIAIGVITLSKSFFNTDPVRPWCAPAMLPSACAYIENIECIGASKEDLPTFRIIILTIKGLFLLIFLFTVILMLLLSHAVFKEEKSLRDLMDSYEKLRINRSPTVATTRQNHKLISSKSHYEQTKIIAKECGSFLLVWLFTWSFSILSLFLINGPVLLVLFLIFTPLQGLWFLIIFCNGKVHMIRRAQRDCSYLKALRLIFTSSDYPDVLFSNITLVKRGGVSIDVLSEGSSYDKSGTKDLSGLQSQDLSGLQSQDLSRLSCASSANDYLSSNLSWTVSHIEDEGDLSHSVSLNHVEGATDLSLDEYSFNDDRGSKVDPNISIGEFSNDVSLFALSSNHSSSLDPLP